MQQLQEDQQQIQYQKPPLKNIVKTFSWLLVLFCLSLFTTIMYSFVYDGVMLHHLVYKNIFLTCAMLAFGLLIAFNVLLNYIFAIRIPPGVTSDFFVSIIQPQDLEQPIPAVGQQFHYNPQNSQFNKSNLTIPLDNSTLGFCGKCQLPKPYRSHHCSICEKCVLKMDHHCPWINNCVGHQNHRHFLLFLTYVFIGSLYFSILNLHILLSEDFKPYRHHQTKLFSVLWFFDIAIVMMMTSFGTWNWYLAFKGYTAIEFINKDRKTTFEQGTRDNLKQIFGQFNHILEIFLPSLRELPSNGVIWVQKIEEQGRINTATD